jgi:hypothetical protein
MLICQEQTHVHWTRMHDYSATERDSIVLYFDFATLGRSASGMNVCCGLCLKPVFHLNRIVAKRSVFLCFLTTRVELMTSTQKKMLRFNFVRLNFVQTIQRRALVKGPVTLTMQFFMQLFSQWRCESSCTSHCTV